MTALPAGFALFLDAIGDIFAEVITYVSTVGTTIMSDPILVFFCALPVVGIGIGLFKRLIRVD